MSKLKTKKQVKEIERFNRNEEIIKNAGLIQVGGNSKKIYLCSKCNNIFKAKRKVVVKNPICRNCMTGASYGEQVAINIFKNNDIVYQKEKTFPRLRGLGNGKLRFDFYIKNPKGNNFIIEIDGNQHLEGEWSKNTREHDIIKDQYCVDNNIKLYRINYVFGKLNRVSDSILSILKREGYEIDCDKKYSYTEVKNRENITNKANLKNKTGKKYYAIKRGRENNKIVTTWGECKKIVDGFPNAKFKSFKTKREAEEYLRNSIRDNRK